MLEILIQLIVVGAALVCIGVLLGIPAAYFSYKVDHVWEARDRWKMVLRWRDFYLEHQPAIHHKRREKK